MVRPLQTLYYNMKKLNCDVLVVGGGGAGLRAAISAKEHAPDCRVALVTKGMLGKSGVTATACSDRMAFHATLPHTEPGGESNWKYHAEDIYRIGGEVSDHDLAEILARNSGEAFKYLDELGVPFVKKNGKVDQFLTDGSKYPRACYTGPYTANHIEEALTRKINTLDIQILENHLTAELLVSEDRKRVIGAIGLDMHDTGSGRDLSLFLTKAIILATGGAGQVFEGSVFPPEMTGDGCAMAYRAGAELVNMEFIQIGICSVKTKLACSGSLMRAIPGIINSDGREFLRDYFPDGTEWNDIYDIIFAKGASWPVSYRDPSHIIDVAVFKELAEGRKVYLDYARNPEGFDRDSLTPLARLQKINLPVVEWLKKRGVDLEKGDKLEVFPAVQHFQGGVKIRKNGETTLKGLYACGECAGGQHGANRPGGNALLDSQVFGKISGKNAAIEAGNKLGSCTRSQAESYAAKLKSVASEGMPASAARQKVQQISSRYASVVREEHGLAKGIDKLREIKNNGISVDKNGLTYLIETMNIIDAAEIILNACQIRTESRGPHLRFNNLEEDKPVPRDDENWHKYVVIKKNMDANELKFEVREPARP